MYIHYIYIHIYIYIYTYTTYYDYNENLGYHYNHHPHFSDHFSSSSSEPAGRGVLARATWRVSARQRQVGAIHCGCSKNFKMVDLTNKNSDLPFGDLT